MNEEEMNQSNQIEETIKIKYLLENRYIKFKDNAFYVIIDDNEPIWINDLRPIMQFIENLLNVASNCELEQEELINFLSIIDQDVFKSGWFNDNQEFKTRYEETILKCREKLKTLACEEIKTTDFAEDTKQEEQEKAQDAIQEVTQDTIIETNDLLPMKENIFSKIKRKLFNLFKFVKSIRTKKAKA